MKKQKNLSVIYQPPHLFWRKKTDILLFPISPCFDQRENTRKDPG